ncbi:hypothetical protein MMC19_005467 [Ptychographa xylographoides]|nr:hypothetical protein [Ptychographa xylographoides]
MSYYSSGWAIRPDLNLTTTAAVDPAKKIVYFGIEVLVLRFSGLTNASAICRAIFETELKDTENTGKSNADDDNEDLEHTETYAEVECLIYDHLKQTDRLYDQHHKSFVAQDDEWIKALGPQKGGSPLH